MVQEILTYLIIAAAVFWAGLKVYRRFFKPAKAKTTNFKKEKITMVHNCSDCAAGDCALRDLPRKVIEKNIDECHDNAVPSSQ
ncbi:hypothetical protein [uncultured Draconibacterium sp.]|uniref:hypothetical protein n=1 Tax=uncultured Draconibacterium sp. TaxID=1573823 RepID=UPI002AA62088|nr:hypothetical protein [uncultured Draconibacterium sp.]